MLGDAMRGQRLAIRILDIGLAAGGGLVLLPIGLAAALAIRLGSPGPALFRQARVGRNERVFTCLKLRTMIQGAPSVATHEAPVAAVTALGAGLRRLKIDELPQLWNVLIGEMSLVGPRPCLPVQLELIAERRAHGVFAVRPGITGSAQIKGIDMSTPRALAEEDAHWAARPTLAAYLSCLVKTALGGGQGDRIRAE